MKVIRNINNNVAVCLDDDNHELIAIGRGIGFHKPPVEIDLAMVDQTFYNVDPHYIALLSEIPPDVIDITLEIVQKGTSYLHMSLNRSLWLSLCDHIWFAIQNAQKGLVISNPLANEIQHLYEKEVRLGEWAVKRIRRKLSIRLPASEAYNIAGHFINAEQTVHQEDERDSLEKFTDDITEIIESGMNVIIDRDSVNYSRFVTHLKYLLKRKDSPFEANSENAAMYETVIENYPELKPVIENIAVYLKQVLNMEPTKDELLYLMIHINRLCARDGL